MKYKKSFSNHKAWLTLKLVRTANKYGWLNTLSYWVQIRGLHKKGIIYNYSLRRLSKQINCSSSTLSTHLEIMSQMGLIKVTDGHLCLIGRSKMLKRFPSAEFAVEVSYNRKRQHAIIKTAILKRKYHECDKINKQKKAIIKIHHSKSSKFKLTKKLLKLQKKLNLTNEQLESSTCNDFILSNKNIGATFYRSQSTGLRLQKQLNQLKLIKSKRNYKIVEPFPISYREFRERYINNKYQHSKKTGLVFRCLPNKIEIVWRTVGSKMKNVVSHKLDTKKSA